MPRIKLVLEYEGTEYVGWQLQANGRSLHAVIGETLSKWLDEPIQLVAASRTDAGVHARGQVVAFNTKRELPLKAYWMGLTHMLPRDISVVRAEEVPASFDPRRWATAKRYQYFISNRGVRSPLWRRTHWEIFSRLDERAMARSSVALVGQHDFSAFRAADCQAAHPIREIKRIDVQRAATDEIVIEVVGTAFLKHMVRNIVGTLIEVGKGKRPEPWVSTVLSSRDRTSAGATAPPHGLVLAEVFYPQDDAGSKVEDGVAEEEAVE